MNKNPENTWSNSGTSVNRQIGTIRFEKPCIFFNTDCGILDCNEVFVDHFNISKPKLLSSELAFHSMNKVFANAILKAVADGISTFHGNVFFVPGTSEIYVECFFSVEESGHYPGTTIRCIILESRFPDSEITSKNTRIRQTAGIPGNMLAAVSIHDAKGKPLYISSSIEALLGYSPEEIRQVKPLDLIDPHDIHIVTDAITKLGNGIESLNSRYRMHHKNGSSIPVESISYSIRDDSVKVKHIVNVTWDLSSLTKVERALESSEMKYYQLMMNLPVGVSLISRSGQLLEANDAMKKIMEIPTNTPLPEINFFSNSIMKRSGISEQLRKCLVNATIVNGDMPYKSVRRRRELYLSYSFLPVPDRKGEVETVIGYVSDLTYQKKAESEKSERADFLNMVINAIRAPFLVKDAEHRWVMLNDAAVEMMGQARETLIGKSDYDLYPKEQADIFTQYDNIVFETGSSSNEEQITWHDGTVHTIVTYKQLYVEKPTGKKFIVGAIHDVSNYKKIEAELRASELKYRELFDNANDFIITIDIDGTITNANRTLLQHLHTDLDAFSRHNVCEFVEEGSLQLVNTMRDKLLAGEVENSFEIEAAIMNGHPAVYEVRASPIYTGMEITGIQCVFSDITPRRESLLKLEEYNKNLVELNKTRDKFFSIIAHDLRNPFSSMIGFAELLLEDLDDLSKDEIRDSLKIIRNSGKNSLNLLENLLDWSRLETGRMPFNPTEVVLTTVIGEVVNVLFSLAYRKKIEIHNMVEPDVVLYADKNMLNTILNNLIMNAIKFTPIGGKILIYAGELTYKSGSEQGFIKISVADTGIGMEADACKKLFSLNKPVSSPGTEKEQGTGLGLLLSREMVEKHGGSILVESTPGKGSVFSILIPAYIPDNIS